MLNKIGPGRGPNTKKKAKIQAAPMSFIAKKQKLEQAKHKYKQFGLLGWLFKNVKGITQNESTRDISTRIDHYLNDEARGFLRKVDKALRANVRVLEPFKCDCTGTVVYAISNGFPLLFEMCMKMNREIAKRVSFLDPERKHAPDQDKGVINISGYLCYASKLGRLEIVRLIFKYNPEILSNKNVLDATINTAAEFGHVHILKYFYSNEGFQRQVLDAFPYSFRGESDAIYDWYRKRTRVDKHMYVEAIGEDNVILVRWLFLKAKIAVPITLCEQISAYNKRRFPCDRCTKFAIENKFPGHEVFLDAIK